MFSIAPGWILDVERGPDWLFVRLAPDLQDQDHAETGRHTVDPLADHPLLEPPEGDTPTETLDDSVSLADSVANSASLAESVASSASLADSVSSSASLAESVANSASLADSVWAIVEQHFSHRLVVECDQLDQLNSYLVGQFLVLHKRVADQGGLMRLAGLTEANRRVLTAAHLESRFPRFDSRVEAVLGSRPFQPR